MAKSGSKKHRLIRALLKTAKRHGKVYKKLAMDTDTAKTIKRHGKVYKKLAADTATAKTIKRHGKAYGRLLSDLLKGKHSPEGAKYLSEQKRK